MPIPVSISAKDNREAVLGVFAPQYFGTRGYYKAMSLCDIAVVDTGMRADRRFKSAHRCVIQARSGEAALSCAVSRFPQGATWDEVALSDHGQWWEKHLATLATNYGPSPFYEYFADDIKRLLSTQNIAEAATVSRLDMIIDTYLRQILRIEAQPAPSVERSVVEAADRGLADFDIDDIKYRIVDLRRNDCRDFERLMSPYPQPWRYPYAEIGFTPGLSVLDAIFCTSEPLADVKL